MVKNSFNQNILEKYIRSIFLLAFFLSGFSAAQAQTNRYIVYFTDKANTPYSISEPAAFLSQRAIQRRTNQNIPVTEEDLPVNPTYVQGVANTGAETYFASRWFNALLIQTNPTTVSAVEALSYVDRVELVAPGSRLSNRAIGANIEGGSSLPFFVEDDLSFEQNELLGVNDMHEDGFLGQGMLIAVLDGGFSGVNQAEAFKHVYDDGRMLGVWNYVRNNNAVYESSSHGTKVLSTIGAFITDNFVGTAHQASFILLVTEDVTEEYRIEEYNWLFGAEYCDSAGVDVINSSVGYYDFDDPNMNYSFADMDGQTAVVTQAAEIAANKGMLVVVSAGNEGNNNWEKITAPADAPSVLAIGAITTTNTVPGFSSLGPAADGRIKPDIMAVGQNTRVIRPSGSISSDNGTSYASPQIAGLAAGIWQRTPALTSKELFDMLRNAGDQASSPDTVRGFGVPNYLRVIGEEVTGIEEIEGNSFKLYPNPLNGDSFYLQRKSLLNSDKLKVGIYNSQGKLLFKTTKRFKDSNLPLEIDMSSFPAGQYLIQLQGRKVSETLQLIKNS